MADGRLIAVTGATGFVGRHMVRALLERGHRVRALARSEAKARRVLPSDGVEIVQGEVLDGSSPGKLVRGADAVIHLIGIIREVGGGQVFKRMHTEATRVVVAAASAGGVTRFLHMSALGANPEGVSKYQKTKFDAERAVMASDLDWTIFRPGLIHGPDGEFFQLMKGWCEGRSAPFLFMPYFTRVEVDVPTTPRIPALPRVEAPLVAPVHVDDVCDAFCEALERDQSIGEIYQLTGPEEIRWPDMLRLVRDTLPQGNRSLKAIGIPSKAAAAQAVAAKAVGIGSLLPFDEGMALMGGEDSSCDTTKARLQLGFEPRAFGESVAEYAGA